jgi:hypothetical protein
MPKILAGLFVHDDLPPFLHRKIGEVNGDRPQRSVIRLQRCIRAFEGNTQTSLQQEREYIKAALLGFFVSRLRT